VWLFPAPSDVNRAPGSPLGRGGIGQYRLLDLAAAATTARRGLALHRLAKKNDQEAAC
jgi:hypothetical protein